jgi:inosine/xanthosine triphosphatase
MKIIAGTKNPAKLQAVREAFAAVFPAEEILIEGLAAPSGVSDQPLSDAETKLGARNRAKAARSQMPEADFYVGLEGGLEQAEEGLWAFAWMAVLDRQGKEGLGRTGAFLLPARVSKLIAEGLELGHANDRVFGTENSKHKGGAVGLLTQERLNRASYYREALLLALIPFLNPQLY